MEKINFVNNNLPAVNQTNLNKLQDNVEDAIQVVQDDADTKLNQSNIKDMQTTSDTDTYSCNYLNNAIKTPNIMTATLSSNETLSSTSYTILPLSSSSSIGTKLSISNDGIKIGAGVTKVKVSAKASFNNNATGLKWLTIFKNTDAFIANPHNLSARGMVYSPTVMIDVQQNDILYMEIQGASGDIIRGGPGNYTTMTVEVVE